jgi:hypothetical protein
MPAILFMGFGNLVFSQRIYEDLKNKNVNFLTYFSLLSFVFINIFFYRIAAHGSDRSAQILILVLIFEILNFINYSNQLEKKILKGLLKIFLLISLIISLKAFYILYLIFLIPIFFYIYKNSKFILLFKYLFFNKASALLLLTLSIVVIKNFLITGCFVYPVLITCFENLSWSLGNKEVERLYNHYQLWSKGGMAPNYIVDNPEFYIQNFNWVKGWINIYFFNKVSDFLLGLLLLLTVFIITFYSRIKINYLKPKGALIVLLILSLLFFEWFYHHPDLRYGGYCILAGFTFIIFSIQFTSYKNNKKKLYKKFYFLIILSLLIFFVRNFSRILEEVKKYNYQPIQHSGYIFEEKHYLRADRKFNELISNYKLCHQNDSTCDPILQKKIDYKFHKYILLK